MTTVSWTNAEVASRQTSTRKRCRSRLCFTRQKLLDAFEEQNVDAYTDAVKEYDTISRLDQWLTTMLLRIKKSLQDDESDLR